MVLNTDSVSKTPRSVNITLVIDRSGSMESIRSDVVGGINQFLADQKAQPGAATLTMIQFDSYSQSGMDYNTLYSGVDIVNAPRLEIKDFQPRGGTPLYDALGRAITEIDALGTSDVQLLAVFTDGMNNASNTYTKAQIFEMIKAREAQGWVISLMMANADAYAEGASMGFARANTQAYAADAGGTQAVYGSFSANTSALRGQVAGGQSINSTSFFVPAGKGAETDLLDRKPDDPAAAGIEADTTPPPE